MLIAMQKYSSSDLKIIMVDDFLDHLDDVMVEHLFKTLSTEDEVQFIIAGVKACDAAAPYIVEVQK
jgi:recombinational DNA repair ATPase RecF